MRTFNGLWFGWRLYNLAEPQESIRIREIVVDHKPIGCALARHLPRPRLAHRHIHQPPPTRRLPRLLPHQPPGRDHGLPVRRRVATHPRLVPRARALRSRARRRHRRPAPAPTSAGNTRRGDCRRAAHHLHGSSHERHGDARAHAQRAPHAHDPARQRLRPPQDLRHRPPGIVVALARRESSPPAPSRAAGSGTSPSRPSRLCRR